MTFPLSEKKWETNDISVKDTGAVQATQILDLQNFGLMLDFAVNDQL